MKRCSAIFAALSLLLFVAQPAHAGLNVLVATIAGGQVQVFGIGAGKKQPIYWEGKTPKVTTSDKFGVFHFSTTDLPIDCVGQLQSGTGTPIDVVINGCTTEQVVGGGVPATGQTTCYDSTGAIPCPGTTGQDGDLQQGVPWPDPRFTDNGDGTITDNLTKLIWLKIANCSDLGPKKWAESLAAVNLLASGQCGLTDGSIAGDWRLPNVRELHSLIDFGQSEPALPAGHPFTNFQTNRYWSSTTFNFFYPYKWIVEFGSGQVDAFNADDPTINLSYAIAVRGGP
jgi:hypothetical protein